MIELTEDYMQDISKVYMLKRVLQNFLARNTIIYYKGYLVAVFDTKTDTLFSESDERQFANLGKAELPRRHQLHV